MKRYKNILIGLILSTTMILGACGDSGANANVNLDSYPESVQNGEISVKYYEQIEDFLGLGEEVFSKLSGLFQDLDEESKIAYKKELKEYSKVLAEYDLSPKTKSDKELNAIAKKVLNEQSKAIEESIAYLDTGNIDQLDSVSKRMKIIMDSTLKLDLLAEGF